MLGEKHKFWQLEKSYKVLNMAKINYILIIKISSIRKYRGIKFIPWILK